MNIQTLCIRIEPWHFDSTLKTLTIEATVDGIVHRVSTSFYDNHFESHFDSLMDKSRRAIIHLVKANENKHH